ncbi:unnamed protein product [Nippostrongylus brasiliensis]|uniref:Uncharacterized protein n=1 Tax=Nippostrongylus brasiliensis TaxID=27835 RepID=A0A0N4Y631_NIPBR|nr:unnamed protein product [Nippostrongylus brasiliensis]
MNPSNSSTTMNAAEMSRRVCMCVSGRRRRACALRDIDTDEETKCINGGVRGTIGDRGRDLIASKRIGARKGRFNHGIMCADERKLLSSISSRSGRKTKAAARDIDRRQ